MRKLSLSNAVGFIALVTLLAGCGSIANPNSPARRQAGDFTSPDKGIVILSTGAPSSCAHAGTEIFARSNTTQKIVAGVYMDNYVVKSDFADHFGLVSTLSLPPDSYHFFPHVINPTFAAINTPRFDFDVQAGETIYIGELFMTISCGLNTRFEIRDNYERDVNLAKDLNQAIGLRPVTKSLMRYSTEKANPSLL